MCIRDRAGSSRSSSRSTRRRSSGRTRGTRHRAARPASCSCLLYTSEAADERSSVDLGGRRIIKKKTKEEGEQWRQCRKEH